LRKEAPVDLTFLGGLLVLIAVLYIVFWIFDKFSKHKPEEPTRGSIDTLCSCRCGLISGGLLVALGLVSVMLRRDALALRGAVLLVTGLVLVGMSLTRRRGCRTSSPKD